MMKMSRRGMICAILILLLLPHAISSKNHEIRIIDEGDYVKIEIDNSSYLLSPGYPVVPYKSHIYTFPEGTKIKNVEVHARDVKVIPIHKKIFCATARGINGEPLEKMQDFEIFPEKWFVCNEGMGIKDGKRKLFLSLHLFPVRYDARENIILYARDFDIKIDYELPSSQNIKDEKYGVLIICPTLWEKEVERLKNLREGEGMKTLIAGLDDIYMNWPIGRDIQEKIKYYIKKAIEKWGIKYVILVGDADIIPPRYVPTPVGEVPTDLYYADIYHANGSFSSWDGNKNRVYGEREDHPDLYPDVYVGRLPASNREELHSLIDFITNYSYPPVSSILVGTELFWETDEREGEYLKEEIRKEVNNMPHIRLYETNDYERDGTASAGDIANYMAKGALFVNFAAHGNPYGMGWSTGSFTINDVPLIDNVYLPVIFAMSCSTNEFDVTDCIGEEFLLDGKAIAYAGSSRVAYVYVGKSIDNGLSGYLDKAFFKAYYDGGISVGEIFSTAKIDYLSKIPLRGDYDLLTLYEYNLLGDPSVMLPPSPLTTKAVVSAEATNSSVVIRAITDENGTVDLYYRKKYIFGGKWRLYGSSEKPYRWNFTSNEEGTYEFYTILRKGNYTENPPNLPDATCTFDFTPPSIKISKPEKGGIYLFNRKILNTGSKIAIVLGKIDIYVFSDGEKVEFYVDDELKYTSQSKPHEWTWNEFAMGGHVIKAIAYDMAGNRAEDETGVIIINMRIGRT